MPITTCVFDAYGTLFDVAAAARLAAQDDAQDTFAQHWPKLAEIWRAKQLQYTWLRAITGAHTNFWEVTQDGLDFALESLGLHQNDALRARLLQLYWELPAYPEVPKILKDLKSLGLNTAILSNLLEYVRARRIRPGETKFDSRPSRYTDGSLQRHWGGFGIATP